MTAACQGCGLLAFGDRMRSVALLCLLTAAFLFLFGLPRLLGAVIRAPSDQSVFLALDGEFLREESYLRAVNSLTTSLSVSEDGPTLFELGLVHQNLGLQAQSTDERNNLFEAALDAFNQSLFYSPVRPLAWAAMAQTRYEQGNLEAAANALDWSVRTSYHLAPQQRPRALLGIMLWDRLEPESRPRIIHAIAGNFRQELDLLARLAASSGVVPAIVDGLRDYEPDGLILGAQFQAAVRRYEHGERLRVAALERYREMVRQIAATAFLVTASMPVMSAAMTVEEYRDITQGNDPARTVQDAHEYLTATLDGLLMLGDFNRREGNAMFCVPREEVFNINVQEFRVALDAMIEQLEQELPDFRELARTRSVGLAALQLLTIMYPCDT